jgi:diacylglycerol kinase family enzyme
MLPLLIKLRKGKNTNHKDIIYFQTNKIRIACQERGKTLSLDFDGESNGALPADIECVPKAIRLFVPKNNKSEILITTE